MVNIQVALVGEQPGGPLQGLRVDPPFDLLVLLHGTSPKSRDAAMKVQAAAVAMQVPLTSIEIIEIDPFGLTDVLNRVIAVRRQHPDSRITVNISGGTNIMASAALLGCFVLGSEAVYIRQAQPGERSPLASRVIRLPVPRVGLEDVKESKLRLLRALLGPKSTKLTRGQAELGEATGMSPQLVSAHLKKLTSWELVSIAVHGRSKDVTLTDAGRLFAQLSR